MKGLMTSMSATSAPLLSVSAGMTARDRAPARGDAPGAVPVPGGWWSSLLQTCKQRQLGNSTGPRAPQRHTVSGRRCRAPPANRAAMSPAAAAKQAAAAEPPLGPTPKCDAATAPSQRFSHCRHIVHRMSAHAVSHSPLFAHRRQNLETHCPRVVEERNSSDPSRSPLRVYDRGRCETGFILRVGDATCPLTGSSEPCPLADAVPQVPRKGRVRRRLLD